MKTSSGLFRRLDLDEGNLSEFEERSKETSQTEIRRSKIMERWGGTEHLRTLAQFQKGKHACAWKIRKREKEK